MARADILADTNVQEIFVDVHTGTEELEVNVITFEFICFGQEIRLPQVAAAAGRTYTLYAVSGAVATDIVQNPGDGGTLIFWDANNADTFTMNAPDEFSVLYCNGTNWYELEGDH